MKAVTKVLQRYGTLIALALIIAAFSVLKPGAFFSVLNFIKISRQISLLVIISIGATVIMSINEFDLAIGSTASLGGVLCALFAVAGLPIWVCFALPVLICCVIGLCNGFIVACFGVLSFVTTLGMSTVISGVIYWLTGGATVFENIPQEFSWLGTYKLGQIPLLSVVMLAFVFAFWFLMRHTVPGRRFYAIGGNPETARVAGINVGLYKTLAFALCSVMACVSGMLIASRVGSANTTAGDGYFLKSYAAVYIGCTCSREGVPNMFGTLVGAAILGVLANGLTMLQMPTYMQDIITGTIIICAVILQKVGKGDSQ